MIETVSYSDRDVICCDVIIADDNDTAIGRGVGTSFHIAEELLSVTIDPASQVSLTAT